MLNQPQSSTTTLTVIAPAPQNALRPITDLQNDAWNRFGVVFLFFVFNIYILHLSWNRTQSRVTKGVKGIHELGGLHNKGSVTTLIAIAAAPQNASDLLMTSTHESTRNK